MSDLPMPSDVREGQKTPEVPQPPSLNLVVRLFLIPLFIAAVVIGIMLPIGLLAGGTPTLDEALQRLKNPGGQRTGEWLVGPGSKQRYMDAQIVTQQMKLGMDEAHRISISAQLIDILDNHTKADEGNIQYFLLLALGRAWQIDPRQDAKYGPMDSPQAVESRRTALDALIRYADAPEANTRKAAILAQSWWGKRPEASRAVGVLIRKLREDPDADVRFAAASALGPLGRAADVDAALNEALHDSDPHDVEIVWAAAGSLAQHNRPEAKDTIMMLLDRGQLTQLRYYDRETDPKNPDFRVLNELEEERILINTMEAAQNYDAPDVQTQLGKLKDKDPSPRVRAAAMEVLETKGKR